MAKEEEITISKIQYEHMVEELDWLHCLQAAGVDNWEGIDMAIDLLENK